MTNTVKIYKVTCTNGYMADEQGSRYSLEPWGNDTQQYQGYDDGGKEYILPDGYRAVEAEWGEKAILDEVDNVCELDTDTETGGPVLIWAGTNAVLTQV